jgi:prepilin-type N-terminal cleavage/methylation domain-containing protein
MKTRQRGFSLIEVLVGLFLVAVAVLGLAQVFLIAVANNRNADRAANAAFLAQQQIDWLRGFTGDELAAYTASGLDTRDEIIDLNLDGTNDFRRITTVGSTTMSPSSFQVGVRVYSAEKLGVTALTLIQNPERQRPRAFMSTLIAR